MRRTSPGHRERRLDTSRSPACAPPPRPRLRPAPPAAAESPPTEKRQTPPDVSTWAQCTSVAPPRRSGGSPAGPWQRQRLATAGVYRDGYLSAAVTPNL